MKLLLFPYTGSWIAEVKHEDEKYFYAVCEHSGSNLGTGYRVPKEHTTLITLEQKAQERVYRQQCIDQVGYYIFDYLKFAYDFTNESYVVSMDSGSWDYKKLSV